MTDVIRRYLDCGDYTLGLRALNVKTAAMNFYWHFHVKEDTFDHPWPRPGHPINFNGSLLEQKTYALTSKWR